jgi:hypothetical protein
VACVCRRRVPVGTRLGYQTTRGHQRVPGLASFGSNTGGSLVPGDWYQWVPPGTTVKRYPEVRPFRGTLLVPDPFWPHLRRRLGASLTGRAQCVLTPSRVVAKSHRLLSGHAALTCTAQEPRASTSGGRRRPRAPVPTPSHAGGFLARPARPPSAARLSAADTCTASYRRQPFTEIRCHYRAFT